VKSLAEPGQLLEVRTGNAPVSFMDFQLTEMLSSLNGNGNIFPGNLLEKLHSSGDWKLSRNWFPWNNPPARLLHFTSFQPLSRFLLRTKRSGTGSRIKRCGMLF
jgi:hypothetical protein